MYRDSGARTGHLLRPSFPFGQSRGTLSSVLVHLAKAEPSVIVLYGKAGCRQAQGRMDG